VDQDFYTKYITLIDNFNTVEQKDIKDLQIKLTQAPTIDDLLRTEEMVTEFFELDDMTRQDLIPFMVYQLYLDSQTVFKYFTSKDSEVGEPVYREFVTDYKAGRTKLSYMVNKLFEVYDKASKGLNKEIEAYHKDQKSQFKYLEHAKKKMHKLFYKGKKAHTSTGSIREISRVFENNHGGFYAKSKAFYLSCDQYLTKSRTLGIKKSHSPATLKTRMKEIVDARKKLLKAYKELGDSSEDCEKRHEEVKPALEKDLDRMVDIYTHALGKAFEEVPGELELLDIAYEDPFDNVNDIESTVDRLDKRSDNLRIIAGYLEQDKQEVEKIFGDLTKPVTVAKALRKYVGDYVDLRSRMLQLNAQIEHHESDMSNLSRPEKEIREINEEISRLERALPDTIQERAMKSPVNNLNEVLDIFIGDIEHIIYNTLNFKDFALMDLRAFKSDLEVLNRSYHRLEASTGGPVRRYLKDRTVIQDVFDTYQRFVNVSHALRLDRETYVNPELRGFSKNHKALKDFHLKIKRRAQDLPTQHSEIISNEIEDQVMELHNRVRDNAEKSLAILETDASDDKIPLEARVSAIETGLKLLKPIAEEDILTPNHLERYSAIEGIATQLKDTRDSWKYRTKKWFERFQKKETIAVKEKKHMLLDTSTIVHDPNCIENFADNIVYIPWEVIKEINSLKDRGNKPHIQRNVRDAVNTLQAWGLMNFNEDTGLTQGASINDKGGLLYVLDPIKNVSAGLDMDVVDDRIIEQAINLKKRGMKPTIVSNDKMMVFKSLYKGVYAEAYTTDVVEPERLNNGYQEIEVDPRVIETYRTAGRLDLELEGLVNNEVIVMHNQDNPKDIAFTRFNKGKFIPVDPRTELLGRISPNNTEQVAVIEGLLCPDIELVAIEGPAGTGKSLLALAAGLDQVYNETYNRIHVYRAFVDVGRGVGYLKGTLEEKVTPWFSYVFDALEAISRMTAHDADEPQIELEIQQYMKVISTDPLFNIRGTSKTGKFMVGAEWQNTTPHESKTFITRAGDGTKVVLEGDSSQIDDPRYLSRNNNGLITAIKSFRGEDNAMGIRLTQTSSRSRLADQANRLMP